MNRIVHVDDDLTLEQLTAKTDSSDFSPDSDAPRTSGLSHCLFSPMDYEKNYSYPLVVWIHGPDDDERQLNQVMPHISLKNYVGVAPRGTHLQQTFSTGVQIFSWLQDPDQIVTALDRVLDCIDLVKARFNVADDRVFIAGYDAGGTMAMRLALASPDSFAGVASFGGAFPRRHMPLRNLELARRLPMMLAYGRDSEDYGQDQVCRDLRLMHAAGLTQLNIRQYPCSDELVTQMLKDFDAWLMERITGQKMDCTSNYQAKFDSRN
jgi:phospholipase/carboxylesterase